MQRARLLAQTHRGYHSTTSPPALMRYLITTRQMVGRQGGGKPTRFLMASIPLPKGMNL